MNGFHSERRAGVAAIIAAAALALAVTCLPLLTGGGPAAAEGFRAAGLSSAAHGAAAQSVLTLRTAGDHDALWLLPPAGGAATAAGVLPGVAENAAVSPDGATVAYLPVNGKPSVWIGYGPLAPKTISLQAAGIKTLTGMTWIAEDALLISGSKRANDFNGYNDRLFTANVTTGAVAPFRSLSGTEPNASFDTGKIVYVKFKKLDNGSPKNNHTPKYRESLMLANVRGSGAGRVLGSEDYRALADYRAYSLPQIAAGGVWIIAGQTGSDVRVTYNIYYVDDYSSETWLTMLQPTPQAAAWSPDSPMVAFGGVPTGPGDVRGCVYVADVAGGSLERTSFDLLSRASADWVMDVAWSEGTKLVIDALGSSANKGASADLRVLLLDAADLSALTDLGEGHLSVWVR
jgi:hypothetical protein